jgi:GT2 family glycosyltransferase
LLSLQKIRNIDFDVLLVDNQSSDGSGIQLKQEFPAIIYLQASGNLGFSGGNNLAIRYALEKGHRYTLLLNNDTTVAPDFLEKLSRFLDEHPTVGAVQPLIYCNEPREAIWNAGSYYIGLLGQPWVKKIVSPLPREKKKAVPVDWITGCAFMVRTELLKKTGLLAEKMFMYFEDVDLSFRIRQLGYELRIIPAAEIWHVGGMSNKQARKNEEGFVNPVVHYLNTRNRIWIIKKYTPFYFLPTVILFHFFYFTGTIGYFLIRARFKKLRAVLKGIRDGLTEHITYANNHPS